MQFSSFDGRYLERLRSGDVETQRHFIAYFSKLIRLKLSRRLRFRSTIEDLQQETFARVWIALRSNQGIRQPERLGAYVNSICNNVFFEHYRRVSKEVPSGDEVGINIPDAAIGVPDAIATKQTRQKVRQILTKLSTRDRLLLTAVFFDERDKDEICRSFGVNREYIRVLLHRAKNSFRDLFLQDTEGPNGRASLESPLPGPNFVSQKPACTRRKRQERARVARWQTTKSKSSWEA
jgi:RNA polymerase sigma-70 factor (ECF subfamily)